MTVLVVACFGNLDRVGELCSGVGADDVDTEAGGVRGQIDRAELVSVETSVIRCGSGTEVPKRWEPSDSDSPNRWRQIRDSAPGRR